MQESTYKSNNKFPVFLNVQIVTGVLGISPASVNERMKDRFVK